jgi:hypothetical protein
MLLRLSPLLLALASCSASTHSHTRRDAAEWAGAAAVSVSRMQAYARTHAQYVSLVRVSGTTVQRVGGGGANWHSDCFIDTLLPAAVAVLQPAEPLWLLVNNLDEPANFHRPTCPPEVTAAHQNVFGRPGRVSEAESAELPFFSPTKIRGWCGSPRTAQPPPSSSLLTRFAFFRSHRDWLYPFGEVCASERVGGAPPRPWAERRDALFWRGSTTGGGDLESNHRVRAVRSLRSDARNASHDVGIYEFLQGVPYYAAVAAPRVEMSAWDGYKYILDKGGNSYSLRLSLVSQLRAAVIAYNVFEDVFSQTLVNGTHVLWANLDGSNIADLLQTLQADEPAARQMGTRLMAHWELQFNQAALVDWAVAYLRAYAATIQFVE